ncbi:MAG: serine/threonine-protein phosphatase [Lachnospiraceae bacterium]|nr:serine/threonine-protein phosphatase [Lachnospiraceae bacterium]
MTSGSKKSINISGKKEGISGRIIVDSLIWISMIVSVIAFVLLRGTDSLKPVYLINISADLSGMVTGFVLYICCMIDVSRGADSSRYYQYLSNAVLLALFSDALAWLLNGQPYLRLANIIDNTIYYICMPVSCFFFWHYIAELLRPEERLRKKLDKIVLAGMLVCIALCIVNLFAGQYFTVDANGEYAREALYPVHQLYGFFMIALCLWLMKKQRRKLRLYQLVAMVLYLFTPLAVSVMTMMIYGLSLAYPVLMAVMLLMYCVVNVSKGREAVAAARDMQVAAAIQKRMLPDEFPAFPGRGEFDVFASMRPAKEVGGDFYDFFLIDDDHLGLVMADVSGKGVPASLLMMVAKSIIKNSLQAGASPAECLGRANRQLLERGDIEMFVTVWLAVLDIRTGEGIAANAGHEHPGLITAGEGAVLVEYKHSPPVAVVEDIPFSEHEFRLNKGDKLFVYTDGVTEAMNDRSELFGEERLVEVLRENGKCSPDELVRKTDKAITDFTQGAEQSDDITMLCLEYIGG